MGKNTQPIVSECEFLKRRYEYVCKRMEHVNPYELDAQGYYHLAYQPHNDIDFNLYLEKWLIEKLLEQIPEGQVMKALASWQKTLGGKMERTLPLLCDDEKKPRLVGITATLQTTRNPRASATARFRNQRYPRSHLGG
jgi:hypothetical protein